MTSRLRMGLAWGAVLLAALLTLSVGCTAKAGPAWSTYEAPAASTAQNESLRSRATPSAGASVTTPPGDAESADALTATPPRPTKEDPLLLEERTVGSYTIRMWRSASGTGMYDHATISGPHQTNLSVEGVVALGALPVEDVTGDGFPDVWFETFVGGSRCCSGTVVYSLGPVPVRVLDIRMPPDYYGTGTGAFEDLDDDGVFEFLTYDPLFGIPCTAPSVKAVLRSVPGQGYVGAGPLFPHAYAEDVRTHTVVAEREVELSREGHKCAVYPVVADYLYSGRPDRAQEEFARLYLGHDSEQFYLQLRESVSNGRFYVPSS